MSLIANSKKPKVLKKNITNNNTPRISYTFTKISNKLINTKLQSIKTTPKTNTPKTRRFINTPMKTPRYPSNAFSNSSTRTPHSSDRYKKFTNTNIESTNKHILTSYDFDFESSHSIIADINEQDFLSQANKTNIFIKLLCKYAKKMTSLTQLLNPSLLIENEVILDLSNTITKFSELIFNTKLKDILFTHTSRNNHKNTCLSFVSVNNNIQSLHNEINKLKEEVNDMKRKYNTTLETNEKVVQINKALENKVLKLESENESNYKRLNELNDKNINCDLLQKNIEILENDLNYKNNVIKYLENRLKATGMRVSFIEDENSLTKLSLGIEEESLFSKEKQINELDNEILSLRNKLKRVLTHK